MGVGKTRPLFSTAGRECSNNYVSDEAYLSRSGPIHAVVEGGVERAELGREAAAGDHASAGTPCPGIPM